MNSLSAKGITHTDEFKRLFINENEQGKYSRQVFKEHGFNIDVIGKERICPAGVRECESIGRMV